MNKWQETIKRVSNMYPGQSLRKILPLAKAEYKKIKGAPSHTKKHKKHKKHIKRSHTYKRKQSHKGLNGRRRMRGGTSLESSDFNYTSDDIKSSYGTLDQ